MQAQKLNLPLMLLFSRLFFTISLYALIVIKWCAAVRTALFMFDIELCSAIIAKYFHIFLSP